MLFTYTQTHPSRTTKTKTIHAINDGEACAKVRKALSTLAWGTKITIPMQESRHTYTAKNQNGIITGSFLQHHEN